MTNIHTNFHFLTTGGLTNFWWITYINSKFKIEIKLKKNLFLVFKEIHIQNFLFPLSDAYSERLPHNH